MLKQKDFIVFSDDWGRLPSSCQHIIRYFLPENRIIWVNTIGIRSPQFTLYDVKRSFEKIWSWVIKGPDKKADYSRNPIIVNPFIIPYNEIGTIRLFNKRSVITKIRYLMAHIGLKEPIVITTFPCTADYVHAFGELVHVYYCVDDFTHWPGVNKRLIKSMEDKLLDECDIVVAASEELCSKKERNGRRPILLPHGVDFEHFNIGSTNKKRARTLESIQPPIIGFFGTVSPWLDFDLIADLARVRPDWSFVFIGPVDTDISKLINLKNIYFVGSVSYKDIPEYAAVFDVAMIPFLVNDLTVSVNPLKLLEYLACGLPVVSTDLPEVRRFSDVVYIAEDKGDFLGGIERAMSDNSNALKNKRIEVARCHSWSSVAERFSGYVEEFVKS